MANALYDTGRAAFLNAQIDWTDDNIKCVLVDTDDYSVNLSTHDFLADIPAGARVATSGNLAGKTSTAGVADANDVTFSGVSGDECEAIVIYKDSGDAATSQLIAYIDTATGLPVTPTGGDITIAWDGGANKIFKL
ncbi:MAG: hypothetical protein DWQ19_12080 [Crenarchaeota archaeon]|nr:MAG: hypothetical protein DWQ19_12080 [Thermoproteota archaeon]